MEIEALKQKPLGKILPFPQAGKREQWLKFRQKIERDGTKSNITLYHPRRRWKLFTALIWLFGWSMRLTGLYGWGNRRALKIKINAFDVVLPNLPPEFDGFQLVHMTDLHFDRMKGIESRITELLNGKKIDLVAFTGDYRDSMSMPAYVYDPIFSHLGKNLKAQHGLYAVLGNHDSADLVPVMERHGIKVLINESIEISRGEKRLTLTGVDDVHYFFTPEAVKALDNSPDNKFKILLVHSPEMVKEAADRKYSLYLCGHTHAGQVTLPGSGPLFTHVDVGREFGAGRWNYKNLEGYTSSGTGVSGVTLRYFTDSEIALITLKCHTPNS